MIRRLKRVAKGCIRLILKSLRDFVYTRILSPSFRSEVTFFERLRRADYHDAKFLEQQLRSRAHQIDKMLTLDTIGRREKSAAGIYEIIDRLESGGITDSATVVWAKEVMESYERLTGSMEHESVRSNQLSMRSEEHRPLNPDALAELMRTRRSIRSYHEEKISSELIREIMRMGLWAPSGCNRQNTEYLVLEGADDIRFCQRIAGEGHKFPTEGSFALVVLMDCRSYALPSQRHMAYLEGGAAIQNMLLYAHSLGIGSIWLNWAGLEEKNNPLRRRYGLPDWLLPVGMVVFGRTKRKPLHIPWRKNLRGSVHYPKADGRGGSRTAPTGLRQGSDPPVVSPVETPTVCILGGPFNVRNLGVSALGAAAVKGVLQAFPNAHVILAGYEVLDTIDVGIGERNITVESMCIHLSDRLRERYGTRHLKALARLVKRLPAWPARCLLRASRTLEQLMRTDLVLDVSGGDSFTDIYGESVFEAQISFKQFIVEMGIPLVLLPQTFGPFRHDTSVKAVKDVIDSSILAATRDSSGIQELRALFPGSVKDHIVACPDMGFALDPVPVEADRELFLQRRSPRDSLIGLNISGMLYSGKKDFGLKDDYKRLTFAIAEWALSMPEARLLLVPHVIASEAPGDDPSTPLPEWETSDTTACLLAASELERGAGFQPANPINQQPGKAAPHRDRVACIGWPYSAAETKYLIGRCDFFIGARMHSCIGAVSQSVPTVTLAYSKKAEGVMSHLGVPGLVADLRDYTIDGCIDHIKAMYERRDEVREELALRMPEVLDRIEKFFTRDLREAFLNNVGQAMP